MYATNDKIEKCQEFALNERRLIIETGHHLGRLAVHYGPALSMADIFAALYGCVLNYDASDPGNGRRDRLILSKGHAYPALYASLCLAGYFSKEEFMNNYMTDGGFLPAHPVKNISKGIETSSGSLGHGLSLGVGKALAAKKKGEEWMTYVLLGDGECEEGSVFEAMTLAPRLRLDNLVIFIDHNKLQQDGTTEETLPINYPELLKCLGWNVAECDGNDIASLLQALDNNPRDGKPYAIVGDTVKGKGVSFMENDNKWHHASLSKKQYAQALEELS